MLSLLMSGQSFFRSTINFFICVVIQGLSFLILLDFKCRHETYDDIDRINRMNMYRPVQPFANSI